MQLLHSKRMVVSSRLISVWEATLSKTSGEGFKGRNQNFSKDGEGVVKVWSQENEEGKQHNTSVKSLAFDFRYK